MSFIDLDQPPRRERRPPPRRRGTDQRTLRQRRAAALIGTAAVLVGLILLIKGCRDSAREQAFKDYVRNVGQMVDQSNQESKGLFTLLVKPPTQSPVELQTAVNGYRTDATALVARAHATSHPAELGTAQTYLIATLELRRDGIGTVADQLPTALGDSGQDQAATRIAHAMQALLASDVLFDQRVVPDMASALRAQGLLDQVTMPTSRFLTDLTWLDPSTTASRMATLRGGQGSGARRVSIGGVTVAPGGQTLTAGSTTQIPSSPNLAFQVTLQNQGADTQHDVVVKVQVSGGASPIVVEQRADAVPAGGEKTIDIPLAATPPSGRTVTISLQIQPVSGVKDSGTTQASFPAVFS